MAEATVGLDLLEALEVEPELATKVTFDRDIGAGDGICESGELVVAKLTGAGIWVDPGAGEHFVAEGRSDAVDVADGSLHALLVRNFDSEDSGHGNIKGKEEPEGLALALLVTGVFADNPDDTFAANDAAGFAEALYRRADFHGSSLGKLSGKSGDCSGGDRSL